MGSERARRVLSRLAGEEPVETTNGSHPPTATDYGRTIEEARAALDDLETAAAFVADGGLDRLERAVERAESDLSERAEAGRETLAAYRAYREAARGAERPTLASQTTPDEGP